MTPLGLADHISASELLCLIRYYHCACKSVISKNLTEVDD